MNKKTVSLSILFADIASSTLLYDTLGDKKAQLLIKSCLSILAGVTKAHKGKVIKTIGDELMCGFPSANAAVEAGKAMHKEIEKGPVDEKPGSDYPNIYIGIHLGPVILEKGDVFGDTVNVAARIMSLAKQRQIIITQQAYEMLSPELKSCVRFIGEAAIKGKGEKFKLYEAIWEENDVTVVYEMSSGSLFKKDITTCLKLKYRGQTFEINQEQITASIGRQSHNEIVVNTKFASRSHARIEFRRGKFVLVDQSSNGTYIYIEGKKSFRLKRDEISLSGSGRISLGQKADLGLADVIYFKVTNMAGNNR